MFETIIIAISLIIVIVFLHKHNKKKLLIKQQLGLKQINLLTQIIAFTQAHRGVSSAILNGDKSMSFKLKELKQKISSVTRLIHHQDLKFTHPRWESYLDHWHRLEQKSDFTNDTFTVLENFNQHTKLIENLLYLLEDVAEDHKLNGNQLTALPNIGFTWRELIRTAEYVGQSRAIGVGIATSQFISQVDKIRLTYLLQQIENTKTHVLANLSAFEPYTFEQTNQIKTANTKLTELHDTINFSLIGTDKITIEPSAYFDLCSQTMSAISSVFNTQITQVSTLLGISNDVQRI